uniref:Uncharacterized protein n=1 Tax=Mycena chlorophos TaxID=658473 RepID=A0ABQ0KY50_MYCCL|nr:predicted protein [Mycena chlorophos]
MAPAASKLTSGVDRADAGSKNSAGEGTMPSSSTTKKKGKAPMPREEALKKNRKNWSKGTREDDILRPGMEAFLDARRKGPLAVKQFFADKKNEYFAKVPWRLQLWEPVPLPLPEYDPTAPVKDELLDDEEELEKARVMADIGGFAFESCQPEPGQGEERRRNNIHDDSLSGLKPPKRLLPPHQQLMRDRWDSHIAPVIQTEWYERALPAGLTAQQVETERAKGPPPHLRSNIAIRLMKDPKYKALKQEMKEVAQREHDAEVAAYKTAFEDWTQSGPAAKQRAIDLTPIVMRPILKILLDATGYRWTLVGGGPTPQFNGEIRTASMAVGKNRGADPVAFPVWFKDFTEKWVTPFTQFCETAYTAKDIQAARFPTTAAPVVLNDSGLIRMGDDDNNSASTSRIPSSSGARQSTSASASEDVILDLDDLIDDTVGGEKDENDVGDEEEGDEEEDDEEEEREAERRQREFYTARTRALGNELFGKKFQNELISKGLIPPPKPPRAPRKPREPATGPPRRSSRNAAQQPKQGNLVESSDIEMGNASSATHLVSPLLTEYCQ